MEIITIKSEEMDQNSYLLVNGKDAVLIDCGMDTFKILREMEKYNVKQDGYYAWMTGWVMGTIDHILEK